jgi:ArsR family transcriptional regulator, arsenate/arsenite/antimonite-responsive transcriptional repressor
MAQLATDIGFCQYRCVSNSLIELTPVQTVACCSPLVQEPIGAEEAERIAPLLKAIADPVRLRLLSLVASHTEGEACVCDLNDAFDLSQPTISHHLKVLRDAGVLVSERQGTNIVYSLAPDFSRRWSAIGASLAGLVQVA